MKIVKTYLEILTRLPIKKKFIFNDIIFYHQKCRISTATPNFINYSNDNNNNNNNNNNNKYNKDNNKYDKDNNKDNKDNNKYNINKDNKDNRFNKSQQSQENYKFPHIEYTSNKYTRPLRPRFPDLEATELPDLSKIDPLLDVFDATTGPIIDPPFPTTRPSVTIVSPETESDDSDLLSTITGLTPNEIRDLQKKALVIKQVKNMTRKGRNTTMYALVVVGNGNGVAGFGEGKHEEAPTAIKKATNKAIKSLRYIERYDDRTIYHDIEYKFHGTVIKFWARPPGFGIKTNHYIHEICKCIGMQDIACKIYGSRNGMNVIKCTFLALESQRLPEQIAKARGKNLFDVYHTYYGSA